MSLLERLPRRPVARRWLLLGYPVAALVSFPTLGFLVRGTAAWMYGLDVFDDGGGLPRIALAAREWTQHGPNLWDPYLTAGNAILGQFAISPYAPDVLLAVVLGPFAAFAITVWSTSALAGIGMHLFLEDCVGLARPAAAVGALVALFCFWHPIYGISVAMLPLVLWLGDRAIAGGRMRWRYQLAWVLLAALGLYEGQIQVVVFVAAIQLAWLLVTTRRSPRRAVMTWVGAWAVAFALFGPVLITQLVLLPISHRTIWDLGYLFGGTFRDAVGTVLDHYGATLFGVPVAPGIGPSEARYGTTFLGGVALPLALIGIVAGRRGRATRFLMLLLVAIPVIDLGAILAAPLQAHLGILESFQFVRIRHFFPFALAATAAIGTDALVTGRFGSLLGSRRGRLALVAAGASLIPVGLQLAIGIHEVLVHRHGFDLADRLDVGWLVVTLGLALGAVGGVVLLVGIGRGRASPGRTAIVGVVLILIVERAFFSNGALLLDSNTVTFDSALARTPAQAYLLRQPGITGQRVLTIGDDANRMAFNGLLQVDGYQAIYPLAYHDYFGAMTAPGLAADPAHYRYFHFWGGRAYAFSPAVDPALVALAGVRWIYVNGGGIPTVPDLVERFQDGNTTVYENPEAFSRAFVVGAVTVEPSSGAVLDALSSASLGDLTGTVFVAAGPDASALRTSSGTGLPNAAGMAGQARIAVDEPDHVDLEVNVARAAVVVLTDVASPGWLATVDGQGVPIATVDGAFRGVVVGPGAHRVVFAYEPTFTWAGFGLAGMGLAVLIGWVLVCRRRDLERRAA